MENVAANLQQRIGVIVSQYEADIAILRDDAAGQIKELQEKNTELQAEVDRLNELVPEEKRASSK